jgi:hypothetical protein
MHLTMNPLFTENHKSLIAANDTPADLHQLLQNITKVMLYNLRYIINIFTGQA